MKKKIRIEKVSTWSTVIAFFHIYILGNCCVELGGIQYHQDSDRTVYYLRGCDQTDAGGVLSDGAGTAVYHDR